MQNRLGTIVVTTNDAKVVLTRIGGIARTATVQLGYEPSQENRGLGVVTIKVGSRPDLNAIGLLQLDPTLPTIGSHGKYLYLVQGDNIVFRGKIVRVENSTVEKETV